MNRSIVRLDGCTSEVSCPDCISTNYGVESTARQGTGLGFAFVLVEDACAGMDAEQHRVEFEKIFPRLARIRATDGVNAALV